MKNITLSADEVLIRKAREKAAKENKSLNAVFRELLKRYAGTAATSSQDYKRLMAGLNHVRPGKKFSRDEMNAR